MGTCFPHFWCSFLAPSPVVLRLPVAMKHLVGSQQPEAASCLFLSQGLPLGPPTWFPCPIWEMPLASKTSWEPPARSWPGDRGTSWLGHLPDMLVNLGSLGGVAFWSLDQKMQFSDLKCSVHHRHIFSPRKRRYFPCSVWVFSIPVFFMVQKFRSWCFFFLWPNLAVPIFCTLWHSAVQLPFVLIRGNALFWGVKT